MLDPMTAVQRRDRPGNLFGPNLDLVGKKLGFITTPGTVSKVLTLYNDPKIFPEYFRVLKEAIDEFIYIYSIIWMRKSFLARYNVL